MQILPTRPTWLWALQRGCDTTSASLRAIPSATPDPASLQGTLVQETRCPPPLYDSGCVIVEERSRGNLALLTWYHLLKP